jgi:hypothetical protein
MERLNRFITNAYESVTWQLICIEKEPLLKLLIETIIIELLQFIVV